MTTDADRAFEKWWVSEHEHPEHRYAVACESWHAAVAWATARARKNYIDGVRDGRILAFVNYGHELPGTSDLDCPHCGGSGHRDDVRPLSPTAVDDKETADIGSNDPRQKLGSSARYGDSHIGADASESVGPLGVDGDPLSLSPTRTIHPLI